jgi:hypothetical protein
MTTCCLPVPSAITLHTPWWRRWLAPWPRAKRQAPLPAPSVPDTWDPADWRTLRHLNAGTLRDIGAPDWVHAGRERQHQAALDLLRL